MHVCRFVESKTFVIFEETDVVLTTTKQKQLSICTRKRVFKQDVDDVKFCVNGLILLPV